MKRTTVLPCVIFATLLLFTGGFLLRNDAFGQIKSETYIGFDTEFNGEALNHPVKIRKNPVTGEIVILDNGNRCLYFFSQDGKFLRKSGRKGQGPGEFGGPGGMDIDSNGNIVVYDYVNNRFSLFSPAGNFKDSFQVTGTNFTHFTVSGRDEIIVNNMMGTSHFGGENTYICEYSQGGKKLRSVGKIKALNSDPGINKFLAVGIPFKQNGGYVVFLLHIGAAVILDESGSIVSEKIPDEAEIFEFFRKKSPAPEDVKSWSAWTYFADIYSEAGRYSVLCCDNDNTRTLHVLSYDPQLAFQSIVELSCGRDIRYDSPYTHLPKLFRTDTSIMIADIRNAEVVRYILH